ncbi:MAG: kelch repeat-containing protein [Candidatus Limnocylindrales bacterium]
MRRIDHRLGLVFLTGAFIASLVAACDAGTATPTRVNPSAAPSASASPAPSATPSAAPSRTHNASGEFVATGSMTMGRDSHTATLLPDGKVLIAGGEAYDEARSAELYDPKTGTFAPTGSMVTGHVLGTATLLLDGRVLFVGGWDLRNGSDWNPFDGSNRIVSASAELYDPKTGTFAPTGSPAQARYYHTATRLLDGRVLIAGGALGANDNPDATATATAEIYDPVTGKFAPTGSMTTPRWCHSATLLRDGRVLMAGSWSDSSAELYDPVKGRFSRTESMKNTPNIHMATLLRDGRVLMTGWGDPGTLAEIYDPATGKFSPTGSMINSCNFIGPIGGLLSSAPLLADGRVLVPDVIYDGSSGGGIGSAELYDPVTGTFTKGPPMSRYRSGFTETLLPDGRVLFTGNQRPVYPMGIAPPTDSASLAAAIEADRASAELYVP